MSNQFITIERDQPFVIPVQEWLAEDHLARFIVAIVEGLDVSALEASYSGGGSAPYPPRMMLALLFYGYATGIFTSRKLEQATYELIPVIGVRAEVDALLKKAEEADGVEPVAGMKVGEEVALRQACLQQIGAAKTEREARAQARYELEKAAYDDKQAQRQEREKQLGHKLGGRAPKPPEPGPRDSDQVNFTDPESRIMPVSGGGFEQCYNA